MVIAVLTAALLLHPLCALLYGCGCSPLWLGGVDSCALMPGAVDTAYACPWCTAPVWLLTVSLPVPVFLAAGLGIWLRRTSGFWLSALATVIGCTVGLLILGLVWGKVVGFQAPPDSGALCGSSTLEPSKVKAQ